MHTVMDLLTSIYALPLLLIVGVLFGLQYHGRGGSFFSFFGGQEPHVIGVDATSGEPYFNYGGTEAARICWWALPVTLETYFLAHEFLPTAMAHPAAWLVAMFPVLAVHIALVLTTIFVLEFLMLFVSLLVLSHGPFQSFGTMVTTKPNWVANILPSYTMTDPTWKRELIDFTGLTLTGALRGVLQCLPLLLISMNFLWLIAGGAMMGVAYAIGYLVLNNKLQVKYFISGTDWGEFFTGLFYGLGTVLAMIVAL